MRPWPRPGGGPAPSCAARPDRLTRPAAPASDDGAWCTDTGGSVSDYRADVQILETELARVEQAFRGLTEDDWRRPTLLQPLGETLPHWTLFELAGHFDISIGLTRMLISSQQDGQVGRDRVSFFMSSRWEP